MKRTALIALDFLLATLAAILGNIVAAYYQEQLRLTDPARFGVVAILFALCLVLLLWVTIKRDGQTAAADNGDFAEISVRQNVRKIEPEGSVTGLEAESLPAGTAACVEQRAQKVSGQMAGMRLGRLGEPDPSRREDGEVS